MSDFFAWLLGSKICSMRGTLKSCLSRTPESNQIYQSNQIYNLDQKCHYWLSTKYQFFTRFQNYWLYFTFHKIPQCQLNSIRGIGSSPSCEQHLKLIILLTGREVSGKGGYARDTCETRKIRLARSFSCYCSSLFTLYLESEISFVRTLSVNSGL